MLEIGTKGRMLDSKARMTEEWRSRVEEEQKQLLAKETWYHSHLPRESLDSVLCKHGDFLLRFHSKKGAQDFVISVLWNGQTQHFKIHIRQTDKAYYIRPEARFISIRELVCHYLTTGESLSASSDIRLKTPAPRDRWESLRKNIRLERKISDGSYGEIWKGSYHGNKRGKPKDQYAAKREDQNAPLRIVAKTYKDVKLVCGGPDGRAVFESEAMYLLTLNHKSLIRTVGVVLSGDPMMILSEYMSKGNLRSYLRLHNDRMHRSRQREMCVDIAKALAYLADHGLVHFDVAARNCLVDDYDHVKILPPSIQKRQEKYKVLMEKLAIKWMAPETMRTGVFTHESDVWSFGVFIWEILSNGAEPWPGLDNDAVRRRVLVDNARLSTSAKAHADLATQMQSCWKTEPESRPTFAQLVLALARHDTTRTTTPAPPPSK